MSKSFTQLGIPFPLFEGPADQANEYYGLDTCSLCGTKRQHCFRIGIGCDLMLGCPKCLATNGLDADDRVKGCCRECKTSVPFPEIEDDEIKACYRCLRAGKAAITKDTELGMVSWEQAIDGITHGVPGLNRPDFEMVPKEDDWIGARLPKEMMLELLRTPTYNTIQGDQWQFCCRQAMVFIGEWSREEFSRRAPDGDGFRLFCKVVEYIVPGLWEDTLHDITGVYVFRCGSCERLRAHRDVA
jgi:uncharacterized protein CbrC (UPF0167 family)